MNDEIKEILLIIKSCKQDYDKQKNGMHTFDYGELYLLYNYITNLQQENERLKETNVYCNRTDCVGRIKDSRKYDSVYQEKEDYKSRCEKASDKLGNYKHYSTPTEEQNSENEDIVDSALNILQNGSDEDE